MPTSFDEYTEKCNQLEDKYKDFLSLTYGFEIDSGWLPVIEDFLQKAYNYKDSVRIVQIKEKYGSLRIYTVHKLMDEEDWDSGVRDEEGYKMVESLIQEASFKARLTCCGCSSESNVTKKYSYSPYCETCYESILSKRR